MIFPVSIKLFFAERLSKVLLETSPLFCFFVNKGYHINRFKNFMDDRNARASKDPPLEGREPSVPHAVVVVMTCCQHTQ